MRYFILIFSLVILVTAVLLSTMRKKQKKGANYYIVVIILVLEALSTYGASLLITDLEIKFFIHELKFIGIALFSVFYAATYLTFFDMGKYVTNRNIILISIVPGIAALAAMTNGLHHWFRTEYWVLENTWGTFIAAKSGWLFYAYIAYVYVLYLCIIVFVTVKVMLSPRMYRQQLSLMLIASFSTIFVNALSVFGFINDFGDATLIAFGISVCIQYFAMIVFKPKRMIQTARNIAFDEVRSPILLFDYSDKLIDTNLSAKSIFPIEAGETFEDFVTGTLEIADTEALASNQEEIATQYKEHDFSMSCRKVKDENDVTTATVLICNNVSEIKTRERLLSEQVNHDPLTHLPNKYAYQKKITSISDEHLPLGLIYLAVNGIRRFSLSNSFAEGDEIILRISDLLKSTLENNISLFQLEYDQFGLMVTQTDDQRCQEYISRLHEVLNDYLDSNNLQLAIFCGYAIKSSPSENISKTSKLALENLFRDRLSHQIVALEWEE